MHAQGSFGYILSNSGNVTVTPGNSGSTTIIATFTAGTASNVTLSCDLTNIPKNFSGTTCAFTPTSVIPTPIGNITRLTVTVPTTVHYGESMSVTVTGNNPSPLAPTTLTVTVAAKIAVNPTANGRASDTPGTPVTVELNMTNSPNFGGFTAAIFYDSSVLHNPQVDYTGNVLGNDATLLSECVNGAGDQCTFQKEWDGQGVVSLQLETSSGGNTTAPNGRLFRVTFTVAKMGFSPIHFVYQLVGTAPDGTPLQLVAYDGYYTNEECSPGNLCKPPLVSFLPPLRPVALRPVSFNGTAVSQNLNGVITEYNWTSGGGLDVSRYNSPLRPGGKPSSNATIIFLLFGQHVITFSAQDNFGARAYYTLSILVFRIWVDLGISALTIDHTTGVFPGTVVHIMARARNNGVNPDNSTLRLSINNQSVANQSIVNLGPILESSLSYNWNTAGLTPRVYRLDIALDEVRNPNTRQILENDTAIIKGQFLDLNNLRVAFVQLIEPVPPGVGVFLGLNLPETLGLGIILVAVIVFATGLVRKSRARDLEPL